MNRTTDILNKAISGTASVFVATAIALWIITVTTVRVSCRVLSWVVETILFCTLGFLAGHALHDAIGTRYDWGEPYDHYDYDD